jgi:PAS domain S-box-containing protein
MDAAALNAEDRFRRLVEDLRLIVWEFDPASKQFLYVSPQAQSILGYPLDEWQQPQFWYQHVHPDDRAAAWRFSNEHVGRGVDHAFEYRMVRADGGAVWFRDITTVVKREGRTVALHGVLIDITQRKEAEDALRANEERLREVFESALDPLWDWDVVLDQTRFSPSWPRLLGYQPAEFDRQPPAWEALVHPDDLQRVREVLEQALRGERQQYEAEYRLKTRDGEWKWVLSRGRVISRDQHGQALRMIGSISDTTARMRAEEALRQSERRFRSMAESSMVGIWQIEPDGRTLYINPSMCRLLGVDGPQDMVARTYHDFFTPESVQVIGVELDKRRRGIASSYEAEIRSQHGAHTRVIIAGAPVLGPEGRVESIIGTFTDITERKQTETALRHSEARLRAIIDNTPNVAIQGYDSAGRVQFWNRATENLSGWSEAEAVGRTLDELILDQASAAEFLATLKAVERTGQPAKPNEWRFRRRDGRAGWMYSTIFAISDPRADPVFICMDVEITERKRVQEELERGNQVHRLLLSELDHRVRNNLASLIGLIDISARDSRSVPEFAASVRDRVQAMSTVHALLSRERWRSVELRQLLLTLAPSGRHEAVSVDGPNVEVLARQATALGMVLQELFANSLKHGALGSPGGAVEVEWRLDGQRESRGGPTDHASRLLRLNWSERGGPPIARPITPSIGTRLIDGLVRTELAGEAALAFEPDGARHAFTLRLDVQENTTA